MAELGTLSFLLQDVLNSLKAGYKATTVEDLDPARHAWAADIASSLTAYVQLQPDRDRIEEALRLILHTVCLRESRMTSDRKAVNELMRRGHNRDTANQLHGEHMESVDAEAQELFQKAKLSGNPPTF